MTATQLKNARTEMRLDLRSMAAVLKMPYRTYQDYEYGKRGISLDVEIKVKTAADRNRQTMARIIAKVDAKIASEFPNGIMSEIQGDCE